MWKCVLEEVTFEQELELRRWLDLYVHLYSQQENHKSEVSLGNLVRFCLRILVKGLQVELSSEALDYLIGGPGLHPQY